MNKRTFNSFRDASEYARRIASSSGQSGVVQRSHKGWEVIHPAIEPPQNPKKQPYNRKTSIHSKAPKTSTLTKKKLPSSKTNAPKSAPPRRLLRSTDGRFTFAIRKSSSTDPRYAASPERQLGELRELVIEYFPDATVNSEIKIHDEIGAKISDHQKHYQIVLTLEDRTLSEKEFDELLNELADEFDRMRLVY